MCQPMHESTLKRAFLNALTKDIQAAFTTVYPNSRKITLADTIDWAISYEQTHPTTSQAVLTPQQPRTSPTQSTTDTLKPKTSQICFNYQNGRCLFGDKCFRRHEPKDPPTTSTTHNTTTTATTNTPSTSTTTSSTTTTNGLASISDLQNLPSKLITLQLAPDKVLTAILDTVCAESIINANCLPPTTTLEDLSPAATVTCLNASTVHFTKTTLLTWSFKDNSITHTTNFYVADDLLPPPVDVIIGLKTQKANNFYFNPIDDKILTNSTDNEDTINTGPDQTTTTPTSHVQSTTTHIPSSMSTDDSTYAPLQYEIIHIIYDGPWLR
ncbi:hypothetical protein FOL47_003670, partial [Perkinsus chesapeaki]